MVPQSYSGSKVIMKIFLVGREKLNKEKRQKVDTLLGKHPRLKGFYWAKEKISELYRQETRQVYFSPAPTPSPRETEYEPFCSTVPLCVSSW